MKKFILLFLVCTAFGYFLPSQINKVFTAQEPQNNEALVLADNNAQIEPPLILEEDIIKPEKVKVQVQTQEKVKKDLEAITAESYMAGNVETGQIYLQYNANRVFPIASLSKFFTAVIATHLDDKEKKISITQTMLDTYGDAGHLVLNEKYTTNELLYPLLLESSNDAAEALAQSFGYDKFIQLMNSLALEIGMAHTSFKDASGLSPKNVSTVSDLFSLARYYYNNEKDLLEITKQKLYTVATTTDHGYHTFISINPFVGYKPFIGGKTGRTDEAKESMISLFDLEKDGKTYPVAVIILRSDMGEREMDTEKIMEKTNKAIK